MDDTQKPLTYLTVGEYAELHHKTRGRIHQLIYSGRIQGLKRLGRQYAIPANAPYPEHLPIGRPRKSHQGDPG